MWACWRGLYRLRRRCVRLHALYAMQQCGKAVPESVRELGSSGLKRQWCFECVSHLNDGFDPFLAVQDGSVSEPIDTIVYCTGTFLFPYTNRAAVNCSGTPRCGSVCGCQQCVSCRQDSTQLILEAPMYVIRCIPGSLPAVQRVGEP